MIDYQFIDIEKHGFDPKIFFPWVKEVIRLEGKQTGDIFYTFCSDDFLLKLNRKSLHHNYYTDIITFPLSSQSDIISAEIFISIDRVTENALQLGTSFTKEMARVMIHGVLHLLGYNDHTDAEKSEMRDKEDYYLSLLP